MSTRLEDDLRSALADATPPPALSFDPEAVLRQGRRTVRIHRTARASAVTLAAALVAAVGAGVLGGGVLGGARRPAGPADGSGPGVQPPVTATLGIGGQRYVVSLGFDPKDDTNLDFYRLDGSGHRQQLGGSSTKGLGADQATWGYGPGSTVVLGVVPAGARAVRAVSGVDEAARVPVSTRALPGTPFEAFAAQVPAARSDEAPLSRVTWTSSAGVLRAYPPTEGVAFTLSGGDKLTVTLDRSAATPVMRAEVSEGGRLEQLGATTLPEGEDRIWARLVTTRDGKVLAYGIDRIGAPELHPEFGPGVHSAETNSDQRPLPGEDYRAFVIELTRADGRDPKSGQLTDVGYVNPGPTWTGNHYR